MKKISKTPNPSKILAKILREDKKKEHKNQ